ncbi:GntR family transcriptional regulator [Hydrogenoanaerobacterium sp.]|uniref:GntR family transcriptional regulator n=1 Tax=Hydrogenoanaerobacterium sp. TaxID=2953763 RepID=UPI0028A23FDD|nr:GntR family transcriptional regulator [Hydrogenoanaerobacterium sp.]
MLEANHATPLYEQLQIAIKNDIMSGVYSLGERMPSEAELGEHYGISRITVRRAVQELEKEGMLERKQGKGTFVKHSKFENKIDSILGFTDTLNRMGRKVVRVIHSKKIVPAEDWVADALKIEKDSSIIELKRTMYDDNQPILYDECYYPCERFPGMFDMISENISTYQLIKEVYGVHLPRAHKRFNVEIADVMVSQRLHCSPGDPLFSIFKLTFDEKDKPVQISKSLVLASRATYILEVDERKKTSSLHLQMKESNSNLD